MNSLRVEKESLMLLNAKYFQLKLKAQIFQTRSLTILILKLTPKQMRQRLPIALVQIKAGNTSENLLNGIRQIIYSLYRAKEITKKVYNNIMNSIKV